MRPQVVVVVVAAGRGTRFAADAHKLAQPLGSSTVLGTTLRQAVASFLPVVVVTLEELAPIARRSVASRDVIVLPAAPGPGQPEPGMGHSIAAGVSARPDAGGWLVLPGDMPLVRSQTLRAVAAALEDSPVAYAQHRGRRGHPVGFGAELYSELSMLDGDEGARRIVARYPALGVEVDDEGALLDVDTVADLARLRTLLPPGDAFAPSRF
jgi:molybdenum cofactor cytidylyltransferase